MPEWLNYHILMGVDRFYIYDNESQVSLRESLKDYIERGWVVVMDIVGRAMQLYAYDHCLQTFGSNTFWMGFIDTDEFLVPKITLDLKEFLKGYEQYGGLAVSSLFFGSNGHRTRPANGQIAAYTKRTHATVNENDLVKSIVQPRLTLMPNSPHDFIFKENAWCVNERLLRVDGQHFPNYTELIQLNHYFCRSKREIELKLRRGRGDMNATWQRKRFDLINSMSAYADTGILQNLDALFQKAGLDSHELVELPRETELLEKMAGLASVRRPLPLGITDPGKVCSLQGDFSSMEALKDQLRVAIIRKEFEQARRLMLLRQQLVPQNVLLNVELALVLWDLGDPVAAWQALTCAWQLSPNNNYAVLGGMAIYFLRAENFCMAENTCRLLLELAPHNLVNLSFLTGALIGQGRYDEALKVGVPVVELSAKISEMPDGLSFLLVKDLAGYLLRKKDYAGAVHLWEAGVQIEPGNVDALLELAICLLLAGAEAKAIQRLEQAKELAPQNEAVLALLKQVGDSLPARQAKKRKHR